jgi:hypothetical protein
VDASVVASVVVVTSSDVIVSDTDEDTGDSVVVLFAPSSSLHTSDIIITHNIAVERK